MAMAQYTSLLIGAYLEYIYIRSIFTNMLNEAYLHSKVNA